MLAVRTNRVESGVNHSRNLVTARAHKVSQRAGENLLIIRDQDAHILRSRRFHADSRGNLPLRGRVIERRGRKEIGAPASERADR
jgi:hypothetical protein